MYLQDLSSNINIKENEKKFQESFDNYWHSANPVIQKKAWEDMWWCIFYACANICKNTYKKRGVTIPDERLEEIIVDSTAYCLKFINKGVRPTKLSSYCYLRCIRHVNDPKDRARTEHETSFLYDKDGHQLDVGEYYDKYEWMEK